MAAAATLLTGNPSTKTGELQERYRLATDLRERYWVAGRRERGAMLDAFCLTTGYTRKYAISMLRGRQRKPRLLRKPRRRRYGKAFQVALAVLWEAAGYICAERLRPFLPDLLQLLEKHRQLKPAPQTRTSASWWMASASRNSLCRVLLPPKSKPVQSSRLRKMRTPPNRSANRGTSSSGVGR